jgi:hypothetical protein
MTRALLSFVAAFLLTLAACGATEQVPIDLSQFDASCVADEDCSLVSGVACGVCACAEEAIATSSLEDYQAAVDAVLCAPSLDMPVCAPCEQWGAFCDDGTCVGRSPEVGDAGP